MSSNFLVLRDLVLENLGYDLLIEPKVIHVFCALRSTQHLSRFGSLSNGDGRSISGRTEQNHFLFVSWTYQRFISEPGRL